MTRFLLILFLLLIPTTAQAICGPGGTCGPNNKVSWTAPTTNVDLTPLTDLNGFKILWSLTPGVATAAIGVTTKDVGTTGISPAPVANTTVMVLLGSLGLPNAKIFMCVKTYDLAALDSGCSNEITFTFSSIPPSAITNLTPVQ